MRDVEVDMPTSALFSAPALPSCSPVRHLLCFGGVLAVLCVCGGGSRTMLGTRLAIMLTGAASAVLWPHSSIYSQAVVLFNRAEEPRTLSISWVRDFLALSGPFPTVGPLWAISAHVQTESVFFS